MGRPWSRAIFLYSASTSLFVGSRMQSRRRRIINGKITSPYWLGWYGPRSRSAIFQIKLALVLAVNSVSGGKYPGPALTGGL